MLEDTPGHVLWVSFLQLIMSFIHEINCVVLKGNVTIMICLGYQIHRLPHYFIKTFLQVISHSNVPWAVDMIVFSRSSLRSENYSMDSFEFKMLRKVDPRACFLQLLVYEVWSESWWWLLLYSSLFSWRLAGEKAVSESLQDLPASSILWTYFLHFTWCFLAITPPVIRQKRKDQEQTNFIKPSDNTSE